MENCGTEYLLTFEHCSHRSNLDKCLNAIARASPLNCDWNEMTYYVFDVPQHKGITLIFKLKFLKEILKKGTNTYSPLWEKRSLSRL